MSIDLSPRPHAAPAARRVWRHGIIETRLTLRNGEQLLLALVIPVAVLMAGRFVGSRFGLTLALLTPGVLAMGIWSTGFTSLAITTAFERRYGVLERLAATPLGRHGVVAGKAISTLLITAGQTVILVALGVALGWRPHLSLVSAAVGVLAVIAALLAFAGFALVLASLASSEVTLGLANLVYLAGVMLGGILWPGASWTPTGALGAALRDAATGDAAWGQLAILAVWGMVGTVLAGKVLKWT